MKNNNNQIKILHIIPKFSYDGASISAFRLALILNRFDNTILAAKKGIACDEINKYRLEIKYLDNRSKSGVFNKTLIYLKFISYLIRNEFQIIQYHQGGLFFLLLSVFFAKKAKVGFYIHSSILSGDNYASRPTLKHILLLKLIDRKIIKLASSESALKTYLNIFPKTKNLYLIKNSYAGKYRKKGKLNYEIGYLGRICAEKGLTDYFDVIKNKKINFDISFSAKGDIYENIQSELNLIISELKIFSPSFDIGSYLNNIDLLIFPSQIISETLPLVLIEAVFYDVGVICYSTEANRNVLGDYPLICTENNPESIVELVNKYYEDEKLRELVSEYNYQLTKKIKSENQYSKIVNLYAEILKAD